MTQQIRRWQAASLRSEKEERRRIGRDRHDEAGQAPAFLRLQLEMIERDAPARLQPRLADVRERTDRTTTELRRIIAALSPSRERLGPETALRLLIKRFRYTHGVAAEYRGAALPDSFPRAAREVVDRVAQESFRRQTFLGHQGVCFASMRR
jgi:signal transduction histidine kinase